MEAGWWQVVSSTCLHLLALLAFKDFQGLALKAVFLGHPVPIGLQLTGLQ